MQELVRVAAKEADQIEQSMELPALKFESGSPNRSMNPTKAGRIYGKFIPSPLKTIKVQKTGGQIVDIPITRKERRVLARKVAKNG